MPAASSSIPPTIGVLGPKRAITFGAIATMRTMIATVIGSNAAPEAKAPNPRTCCR